MNKFNLKEGEWYVFRYNGEESGTLYDHMFRVNKIEYPVDEAKVHIFNAFSLEDDEIVAIGKKDIFYPDSLYGDSTFVERFEIGKTRDAVEAIFSRKYL